MAKDLTDFVSVINQMRDIKDSITRLQERYDLLKNVIVEALAGESAGGIDGRPVVAHSTYTQRRFDAKAFAEAQPQIYENFKRETTASRFILIDQETDNGQA